MVKVNNHDKTVKLTESQITVWLPVEDIKSIEWLKREKARIDKYKNTVIKKATLERIGECAALFYTDGFYKSKKKDGDSEVVWVASKGK